MPRPRRPDRNSRHRLGETCPACHTVHKTAYGNDACIGHSRNGTGKPCRNNPRPGLQVCHIHGGNSPQAKAAAAQRLAVAAIEADTAALLAAEGLEAVEDPVGAISRLATEALALKRAAGARVNALDHIRYTGGLQRAPRGELVGTGTEQIRAEVALYERALDRSMRFLEIVAKHADVGNVARARSMLDKLSDALALDD